MILTNFISDTYNTLGFFGTLGVLLTSLTFLPIFISVIFILVGFLVEYDETKWANTIVSVGLVSIFWFNKDSVISFLTNDFLTVAIAFVGYVFIGVLWSFLKWYLFVSSIFSKFDRVKNDFKREYGEITDDNFKIFRDRVKTCYGDLITLFGATDLVSLVELLSPKATDYKAKLMYWITYWPMSLLATLINDPIRKLFILVYDYVSSTYDRMVISYKKDALK